MERKNLKFDFELKGSNQKGDFFEFEGLASTFQKDLDNDVIEKGAFTESLTKRMPVILFQHDSSAPIGVTTEAFEKSDGLFIRAKLPLDDELVKGRVIPQMKVGSIKSMSIGFSAMRNDMEIKGDVRHIKKVDLHEISLVTFPANPGAQVTGFKSELKDILELKNKRELENHLRELGMSQKAAVYLASKVEFADEIHEKQMINKLDNILGSIKNV